MKVLVADDEPDVAALVAMGIHALRPEYEVVEALDGAVALRVVEEERPDLVILDLAMPVKDGFTVLRELREKGNEVPVIVLTAKGLETEKVRGLELGADDYVTKPFSQKELAARVDAVLRRQRIVTAERRTSVIEHGDLRIDFAQRLVSIDGRAVALTPTEYNLLYHLALNAGQLMPHATLLAKVWGPEYLDEVHYLKVYVGRLRNKIEADPQRPEHILTVRGVGYRFPALAEETDHTGRFTTERGGRHGY
ncbi:MAG: response regulator transcription factor [Chloroflexota bacterium]|nr:response regulator transcription factor [Chloroflexota bacterium]MDE3194583.1 response regulator transcription factor [Chloroflexota bacterium]